MRKVNMMLLLAVACSISYAAFSQHQYAYVPRQWSFIADMDYSRSINISDVWLWIKWLFFYPGDSVIYFLIHKASDLGDFLEISYDSYAGTVSGIFSFVIWSIVFSRSSNMAKLASRDAKQSWQDKMAKFENKRLEKERLQNKSKR